MKKRHTWLLMLLLLIVTGGVYATWTYATKQATDKEIGGNSIDIENAEVVERGVITTNGKTFMITFDDVNFNHKVDKNAQEVKISGDDIVITFTPAQGSNINTSIANYHLTFILTTTLQNKDQEVVLTAVEKDIELTWDGAAYVGNLTTAALFESITDVKVNLPTKDDYDAFKKSLETASFIITLKDNAASAQIA